MDDKTPICVVPGCGQLRWTGRSGRNTKLTMCQEHQTADWRKRKQTKREQETERVCTACGQTFPLTEEYFYLRQERGTFRRQCKSCYDKRQVGRKQSRSPRPKRQPAPAAAAPVQPEDKRRAAIRGQIRPYNSPVTRRATLHPDGRVEVYQSYAVSPDKLTHARDLLIYYGYTVNEEGKDGG